MYNYLELLQTILSLGDKKDDRTGVGTTSIFGAQFYHNLRLGFPILTTKKVWFRGVFEELRWMLSGSTNIKDLHKVGVHIWDEWADYNGDLGPVYGQQWRGWFEESRNRFIDQIADVVKRIKTNPNDRRIILSAWNVAEVEYMKLPPCHVLAQFNVTNGALSCHMYQRSADAFLGVPFNIAQYALLTHLLAHVTNLDVGRLIISYGDLHIYNNHHEQVAEQLRRIPEQLPILQFNCDPKKDPVDYSFEDVTLVGYNPQPAIKADVAI